MITKSEFLLYLKAPLHLWAKVNDKDKQSLPLCGKKKNEAKDLLKYCALDTLATVKIWERLKEISN